MLWGERVTRRRAIVGILVAFALADAALAFVVLGEDGAAAPAPAVALPLHPVAGNFVPDDTQLVSAATSRASGRPSETSPIAKGPKPALALVDDVYGSGGSQSCHRVVHAIGAASLARYRGSVARTFAEGDSIVRIGLLPRRARALARQRPVARAGRARAGRAHALRRRRGHDSVDRVPVPARARPRADDRDRA